MYEEKRTRSTGIVHHGCALFVEERRKGFAERNANAFGDILHVLSGIHLLRILVKELLVLGLVVVSVLNMSVGVVMAGREQRDVDTIGHVGVGVDVGFGAIRVGGFLSRVCCPMSPWMVSLIYLQDAWVSCPSTLLQAPRGPGKVTR